MNAKAHRAHCENCPLRKRSLVPPSMPENAVLAVVGEAPGRTEAIKKVPFIGPSGALLWGALDAVGIDRSQVHVTNAVLCFPGREAPPPEAVECCRDRLMFELVKARVKYVLALGNTALHSLVDTEEAISFARGRWTYVDHIEEDTEYGWWALPTYHPAYLLRSETGAQGGREYLWDIEKFVKRSPEIFQETKTLFWHYPDSKMRKWLDPDLKRNHDIDEWTGLRAYCAQEEIPWIVSERLADNKVALRTAAKAMIEDIVVALDILIRGSNKQHYYMAIDLETTGYTPYRDRILNLSLSWSSGRSLVISGGLLWQKKVKAKLIELFNAPYITWIGHNGKFDMKFLLEQLGAAPTLHHDTYVLHCALDERSRGTFHALKPLVSQYFDVADYEHETISMYLPSKKTSFANVPPSLLGMYAGMDTDYTRRLWFKLMEEVSLEPKVERMYLDLLMPACRAFIQIEMRGVKIDWERLTNVAFFLEGKADVVLERLRANVGDPNFNPNSHVQTKRVLWDEKGYSPPTMRGKTSRSTKKEVLKILANRHPEDEFLALMQDIRRYRKLMSSYVRNVHKFADDNGRVHPVFNLSGTEVGRLSASNPAIQTIPRAYEATGKLIRDFYVASPGYVYIHADYSQAELRVAAVLSQDAFLLNVYRSGRDLHTEVAISMYGPDFTQEQRNICKMFNFAYLYGGTQHSFAYDSGMNISAATTWVKRYNRLMIGLATWRKTQYALLQEQGFVQSPTGRKRRFPLLLDSNAADAKKSVVHAPCAGTASDLTILALTEAQRTAPDDVFPLITVHDSDIVECPDDDVRVAETAAHLKQLMEDAARKVFKDEIPFVVDIDVGYRWGTLVSYDGTPAWREKVDMRPLFEQTEFLERMQHEICEGCGRWNPPRESRSEAEPKCLTCGGDL